MARNHWSYGPNFNLLFQNDKPERLMQCVNTRSDVLSYLRCQNTFVCGFIPQANRFGQDINRLLQEHCSKRFLLLINPLLFQLLCDRYFNGIIRSFLIVFYSLF